jgi:uncharacterized membrane protein
MLLVPFLGLWLLEPLLFLGALPTLGIILLSSKVDEASITYNGAAAIFAFVLAASIFGAARFKEQAERLSLWALVGAACFAALSPISHLPGDVRALGSPLAVAKTHAFSLVPPGVPVSATNSLGGQLSERRYIYTFPYAVEAHWIVVDINDPAYDDGSRVFTHYLRRYEASKKWQVVFSSHGIVVLHKRSTKRP